MTDYEELVRRPVIAKELGVSHRSICRWEKEKRLGFDQSVKIGRLVFHPRRRIEDVKAGRLQPHAGG